MRLLREEKRRWSSICSRSSVIVKSQAKAWSKLVGPFIFSHLPAICVYTNLREAITITPISPGEDGWGLNWYSYLVNNCWHLVQPFELTYFLEIILGTIVGTLRTVLIDQFYRIFLGTIVGTLRNCSNWPILLELNDIVKLLNIPNLEFSTASLRFNLQLSLHTKSLA